jgi:hypothetical protein
MAQQMNVLNSRANAVTLKSKTVLAARKGMLADEEKDSLRGSDPITLLEFDDDLAQTLQVLPLSELTKNDSLMEIDRLWAICRNAIGIPEQELGGPGQPGEKATKSMLLDKSSKVKHGARKGQLWMALEEVYRKIDKTAQATWAHGVSTPDDEIRLLLSPNEILRGRYGIDRSGSTITLGGISAEQAQAEMDVYIDPIVMTPMDREKLAAEIFEDINIGAPIGAIDPWEAFTEIYRLRNVRMPNIMRQKPETLDAGEEHILILQGQPVQVQPGENIARHAQRHQAMVMRVQQALGGGQVNTGDPVVDGYVQDAVSGGDALQRLMAHAQETAQQLPGPGGASKQGAVDPNAASQSAATRSNKAQQAEGVPFGARNAGMGGA